MRSTTLLGLLGVALAVSSSGMQPGSSPPLLPDASKTPGDVLDVTKADICVPGYTKKVRNVPTTVKKQVFTSYHIANPGKGEFEVDHLISLELGGSNSIKNLWPQSYKTQPWNAHVKDALENRLHKDICSGSIDMKVAQQAIAKDWIACYKQTFHTDVPLSKGSKGRRSRTAGSSSSSATATSTGQVWVNTKSGKYFLPGSRYYGKTKEGTYMTETEAKKKGYTPAKQ